MSKDKSNKNWFVRHKILSVLGAIVIIIIIASIASGGNKGSSNTGTGASKSSSGSTPSKKTAATAKLNQQANDGKLGFTVASFQCGVTQIEQPDDTDYTVTAGAPYCEMNLSIKGISNVAQTFDDDSQYIYSPSGTQYSVDDDATIAANDVTSNCMEDPTINPGVTITCSLAFDVPANVTPAYATLHDSSLSDGVKVSLQ